MNSTTDNQGAKPQLTLYMRDYCMYCNRVLRVIDDNELNIPIRNIWEERQFEQALVEGTGRRSVPVLHIQTGDGDQWMPESADIMRYLMTEVVPESRPEK